MCACVRRTHPTIAAVITRHMIWTIYRGMCVPRMYVLEWHTAAFMTYPHLVWNESVGDTVSSLSSMPLLLLWSLYPSGDAICFSPPRFLPIVPSIRPLIIASKQSETLNINPIYHLQLVSQRSFPNIAALQKPIILVHLLCISNDWCELIFIL